jgi:uncharacterized protein YpmB
MRKKFSILIIISLAILLTITFYNFEQSSEQVNYKISN